MQESDEQPRLNSPQYWNARFLTDWAARQGQKQTTFFAQLAANALPDWFVTTVRNCRMSLFDYGCAFGDALPVLRKVFPESDLRGGDVAPVALAVAGCVHPEFRFEPIAPDGTGDILADVIYCSNTLEHFADWRARLTAIARRSRQFCVLLVPFREAEPREPEHMASFDYDTLPQRLNNDFQLLYLATIDAGSITPNHWPGEQLLAIYGRPSEQGAVPAPAALREAAFNTAARNWSVDLRGMPETLSGLVLELRRESVERDATLAAQLRAALADAAAKDEKLKVALDDAAAKDISRKVALDDVAARNLQLGQAREHIAAKDEALSAALQRAADADRKLAEARDRGETFQKDAAQLRGAIEHLNVRLDEASVSMRKSADELAAAQASARASSEQIEAIDRRARRFGDDIVAPLAALQDAMRVAEIGFKSQIDSRNAVIARLQQGRSVRIARLIRRLLGQRVHPTAMQPAVLTPPDLGPLRGQIDELVRDVLAAAGGASVELKVPADPVVTEPPAAVTVARPSLPPVRFPQHAVALQLSQFDRGGLEQVVFDLAWGFRNRGFPVAVVSAGKIGQLGNELQSRGVPVLTCDGDESAHRRIVSELNASAVFLNHSYLGLDNWKAAGVGIFDIVHNYYFWQDAERMRATAQASRKVIGVSEAVTAFHAQAFGIPRESFVTIANPLHPEGLYRPSREQLRRIRARWKDEFIFVNVAHFYPAKAHVALVTAFAEVHKTHPHARLKLLGAFVDPRVEARVRETVAATHMEPYVSLPGLLGRRQVASELATAHAFVLPSIYEGCSVALGEAAYYGLPLILSNVGSASKMIENEDCGILISAPADLLTTPPSGIEQIGLAPMHANHRELVDAMRRLIDDYPVWSARGFAAQGKIESQTIESRINEYCQVAGLPVG